MFADVTEESAASTFHLPEDGDTTFLRNVGKHLQIIQCQIPEDSKTQACRMQNVVSYNRLLFITEKQALIVLCVG
jgi:hypothetical protein